MSMDDLPPPLLLEILNRIRDSTDLARCRLASKTLKSLSYEVRSLILICSFDRYLRSRSPDSKTLTTPFKSIVKKNLLYLSKTLESVSVSIEKPFCDSFEYDDGEDEYDDLHLTSVDFVSQWLPEVGERLRSLSISDFWIQSCWRKSEVLALISACCDNSLLNLELKNAWLSVEGLKPMPMLTSLTLEFIRLDDEDLNKGWVEMGNVERRTERYVALRQFLILHYCQQSVSTKNHAADHVGSELDLIFLKDGVRPCWVRAHEHINVDACIYKCV